MLRQVQYALFDMRIHHEPQTARAIQQVLDEVHAEVSVLDADPAQRLPHSFSHIFAGGYGAGYYSYKWAEVLSADAYSAFEEMGLSDIDTGRRYRREILEVGGSRDALDSFKAFRGREPSITALLRHQGITRAVRQPGLDCPDDAHATLPAAFRPALALAVLALPSHALFKVVAPDGTVTYTDRPPPASAGRPAPLGKEAPGTDASAALANLPLELRQTIARFPVTLYTSTDCSPCESGRRLLQSRGVPFTERRVLNGDDAEAMDRLTRRPLGADADHRHPGVAWLCRQRLALVSGRSRLSA